MDASQMTNEFTGHYGISNISNMANAAFEAAQQVQNVTLPLAGIAALIFMARTVTNLWIGEGRVDWMRTITFFGTVLFLSSYNEVMGYAMSVIEYFSNSLQPIFGNAGSGKSLPGRVMEIQAQIEEREYAESVKENGVIGAAAKAATDALTLSNVGDLFDLLIASCTHMIILVARTVTYCVREVSLMFLIAVGPIAVVLGLFPGFQDNVGYWFKQLFSVGMWGVSLGVLDMLLNIYLENMLSTGDSEGFIPFNICLALMYCMAPKLTSKFISSSGGGLMQRITGYVSRGGSAAKQGISNMLGKAASASNPVTATVAAVSSVSNVVNNSTEMSTAASTTKMGGGNSPISRNSNIV